MASHTKRWLVAIVCLVLFMMYTRYTMRGLTRSLGQKQHPQSPPIHIDPSGDIINSPEPDREGIQLCFDISTLLNTGGTEAHFFTFFEVVFRHSPFALYAVQHTDYFTTKVAARLQRAGVRVNPGYEELIDHCDVLVETGVVPLPSYGFTRRVPRVLIVHGANDPWTKGYAAFAALYDAIVCVSAMGRLALPEPDRPRAVVIPNTVFPETLVPRVNSTELLMNWHVPLGKRVLLFLGRVSVDKDPQFFLDVVDALPLDWIGLVVGPIYLLSSIPKRINRRTFFVGRWDHVGDALAACEVLVLPSRYEGGPIVLLEAWATHTPIFMRPTGIANAHPEGVFLIGNDESPVSVAERVVQVADGRRTHTPAVQSVLDLGFDAYSQYYSADTLGKKWRDLLVGVHEKQWQCLDSEDNEPCVVSLSPIPLKVDPEGQTHGLTVRHEGHSRRVFAAAHSSSNYPWIQRAAHASISPIISRAISSQPHTVSSAVRQWDRAEVLVEAVVEYCSVKANCLCANIEVSTVPDHGKDSQIRTVPGGCWHSTGRKVVLLVLPRQDWSSDTAAIFSQHSQTMWRLSVVQVQFFAEA